MAKRKSYKDIQSQFNRIWHSAIAKTDAFAKAQEMYPNGNAFQIAENVLQGRKGYGIEPTAKDKRISATIDKADSISSTYLENLRRKSGFSDVTPYYATGDRLKAYTEFTNRKFSQAAYRGLSVG